MHNTKEGGNKVRKHIFSILACLCLLMVLLPISAFAADPSVTVQMGGIELQDGKYYTEGSDPSIVIDRDEPPLPEDGIPYFYYDNGVITVYGDVSLTSAGPITLSVSGGTLEITGGKYDSLTLSCGGAQTVVMGADDNITLSGSLDFTVNQTGVAPAVDGGTLQTADDYSGDITINANGSSALLNMDEVNLQTSGDITINGGSSSSYVITSSGDVTLEGSSVNLTHNTDGPLISAGSNKISITATNNDLDFYGEVDGPLLSASSTTLSANGDITVENATSSNGIAVNGDLTIAKADNVTVTASGMDVTGDAVNHGNTNITASGDVAITSQNGPCFGGSLTVNDAKNVTVTSNGGAPTIVSSVDINVSGDVLIENTGSSGAILGADSVSIDAGSITVIGSGKGTVISLNNGAVSTLSADGNVIVQRNDIGDPLIYSTDTPNLSSENGAVILTDPSSTSATIDGTTISADAFGGDASGGLDLYTNTPLVSTFYTAGDGGYVLWEPDIKIIALHNATINNEAVTPDGSTIVDPFYMGIALPISTNPIGLAVEGTNKISSASSYGIGIFDTSIAAAGEGTLSFDGATYGMGLSGLSSTFQLGEGVALNGIVFFEDNPDNNYIVYGDETINSDSIWNKYVIFADGSALTVPENVTLDLKDADITNYGGQIINNGIIILPYNYTEDQIKALNITGDGEVWISDGTNKKIYIDGDVYSYGGDVSDLPDFSSSAPIDSIYYGTGDSYILFNPAVGETPATLTLHNVDSYPDITTPSSPITMVLEGENFADIITEKGSLTISGSGTLDANLIYCASADDTLNVNSGTTLNALCISGSGHESTYTVYGSYAAVLSSIDIYNKLVLSPGSVLTVESLLVFYDGTTIDDLTIGDGASIVNHSIIALPSDTTTTNIANLPISGSGVVYVVTEYNVSGSPTAWDVYTNDGTPLTNVVGNLTLTDTEASADGYTWLKTGEGEDEVWTLTLGNIFIDGDLTLPDQKVVINTTADSNIKGDIKFAPSSYKDLTFTGAGKLNLTGYIHSGGDGGEVTIDEGADVIASDGFYVGISGGVNGVLNVNGTFTASSYAAAINTGKVKIGSSGVLNVNNSMVGLKLNGMNDGGDTDYDDAFVINNGGTLNADCTDANIMVFTSSNEATEEKASDAIVLPDGYMPDGYLIRIVSGENGGTQYAYTIAKTAADLTLKSELVYGAGGKLTLQKPSNNDDDDDDDNNHSSHDSGSVVYVLTFDTNGGSKISKVYKAYGTVIKLSDYVPTYDGYDFDGWYSDEKLTDDVTSVKLRGNTTVYAKWTEEVEKETDSTDSTITDNPFTDVADGDYYHDAVLWAVDKGITSGTTDTTFSPEKICTRAQMVTLLWKAMGSPEPEPSECAFTDVDKDAYYYDAVIWAVENGITSGTTPTTFGPNETVTRAQAVTFIWRAEGNPVVNCVNPFTDVSGDDYCYNAIMWAVEKDITQGSGTDTFSPADYCTRAQIVAFLYRAQL